MRISPLFSHCNLRPYRPARWGRGPECPDALGQTALVTILPESGRTFTQGTIGAAPPFASSSPTPWRRSRHGPGPARRAGPPEQFPPGPAVRHHTATPRSEPRRPVLFRPRCGPPACTGRAWRATARAKHAHERPHRRFSSNFGCPCHLRGGGDSIMKPLGYGPTRAPLSSRGEPRPPGPPGQRRGACTLDAVLGGEIARRVHRVEDASRSRHGGREIAIERRGPAAGPLDSTRERPPHAAQFIVRETWVALFHDERREAT